MADFVLLHGSGQNASCWSRVGSLLTARGHAVAAPDLPKHAPDWQLGDFAVEIARSVVRPDTVVVAHSFSGVFLPLVAQASDCGLLVFLAAVIPEPGKSVRDQFAEDPGMFSRSWIEAGPRWFDPSQREALAEAFLFHDCGAATLPWALGTIDLFDTRHLVTQPAPFTRWPGVPTASIVSTDDRTLTADWGRRVSLRVLGRDAAEIRGGHCPHVSQPEAVADILEQLATRHSERRATW
jgi:pimeloyl-ACP methyl ester carboxylesterase